MRWVWNGARWNEEKAQQRRSRRGQQAAGCSAHHLRTFHGTAWVDAESVNEVGLERVPDGWKRQAQQRRSRRGQQAQQTRRTEMLSKGGRSKEPRTDVSQSAARPARRRRGVGELRRLREPSQALRWLLRGSERGCPGLPLVEGQGLECDKEGRAPPSMRWVKPLARTRRALSS